MYLLIFNQIGYVLDATSFLHKKLINVICSEVKRKHFRFDSLGNNCFATARLYLAFNLHSKLLLGRVILMGRMVEVIHMLGIYMVEILSFRVGHQYSFKL